MQTNSLILNTDVSHFSLAMVESTTNNMEVIHCELNIQARWQYFGKTNKQTKPHQTNEHQQTTSKRRQKNIDEKPWETTAFRNWFTDEVSHQISPFIKQFFKIPQSFQYRSTDLYLPKVLKFLHIQSSTQFKHNCHIFAKSEIKWVHIC